MSGIPDVKERVQFLKCVKSQHTFDMELMCLLKEAVEFAADSFEGMKGEEFKEIASIWRDDG